MDTQVDMGFAHQIGMTENSMVRYVHLFMRQTYSNHFYRKLEKCSSKSDFVSKTI